ncbi:unnamed protein product [Amoebophrya sp. A120]|nr:unnamed protein product [Amoebophrya sp. A120]|eukprot:GSA120T00010421001.1
MPGKGGVLVGASASASSTAAFVAQPQQLLTTLPGTASASSGSASFPPGGALSVPLVPAPSNGQQRTQVVAAGTFPGDLATASRTGLALSPQHQDQQGRPAAPQLVPIATSGSKDGQPAAMKSQSPPERAPEEQELEQGPAQQLWQPLDAPPPTTSVSPPSLLGKNTHGRAVVSPDDEDGSVSPDLKRQKTSPLSAGAGAGPEAGGASASSSSSLGQNLQEPLFAAGNSTASEARAAPASGSSSAKIFPPEEHALPQQEKTSLKRGTTEDPDQSDEDGDEVDEAEDDEELDEMELPGHQQHLQLKGGKAVHHNSVLDDLVQLSQFFDHVCRKLEDELPPRLGKDDEKHKKNVREIARLMNHLQKYEHPSTKRKKERQLMKLQQLRDELQELTEAVEFPPEGDAGGLQDEVDLSVRKDADTTTAAASRSTMTTELEEVGRPLRRREQNEEILVPSSSSSGAAHQLAKQPVTLDYEDVEDAEEQQNRPPKGKEVAAEPEGVADELDELDFLADGLLQEDADSEKDEQLDDLDDLDLLADDLNKPEGGDQHDDESQDEQELDDLDLLADSVNNSTGELLGKDHDVEHDDLVEPEGKNEEQDDLDDLDALADEVKHPMTKEEEEELDELDELDALADNLRTRSVVAKNVVLATAAMDVQEEECEQDLGLSSDEGEAEAEVRGTASSSRARLERLANRDDFLESSPDEEDITATQNKHPSMKRYPAFASGAASSRADPHPSEDARRPEDEEPLSDSDLANWLPESALRGFRKGNSIDYFWSKVREGLTDLNKKKEDQTYAHDEFLDIFQKRSEVLKRENAIAAAREKEKKTREVAERRAQMREALAKSGSNMADNRAALLRMVKGVKKADLLRM